MMIMASFTELFMPGAAGTNESVSAPEATDQAGQDFAALLAAWFTPTTTPIEVPTPLSCEASGGQGSDSPSVITADQQANSSAPLSFAVPAAFTNQVAALSTPMSPLSPTSLEAIRTASTPVAPQPDLAASLVPLPMPTAVAKLTSVAEGTPFGFDVADPAGPGSHEETTSLGFETEAVKVASQVVKDILAEAKPATPWAQHQTAGTSSHSESNAESLPEPVAVEQTDMPFPEADTPVLKEVHSTVTAPSLQATSTSAAPAQASRAQSNSAQPIVHQTIDPLLELAQRTLHQETRSLRFQLHPEALGRVEVEVTRDAEGRVSASLNAERIEAATTLTHSISHLREALEKAGVNVEHLDVFAAPQHQNNSQGQTAQQQPSHTPRTAQSEFFGLELASEESPAQAEEEKLLNLRA